MFGDISWLPRWAEVLIWVGIIVVAALICVWVVRLVERRSAARVMRRGETVAARQRVTALSALATGVIYTVVLTAIVGIVATIFGAGSVAAISGSAFVILVLGFAVRGLLSDVVAGFFILFEGQYAVGDLVWLEPTLPMGIVKKASLRVTVIQTIDGDVMYLPNSLIKGARRLPHGSRNIEIGVLVSDVAPVARAASEAGGLVGPGGVRFATAPMVTGTDDLGDDLHWVRVHVNVPPGFEWMASGLLVDIITARCGDALKGDPIVQDIDRGVHAAYRKVLADSEGVPPRREGE